MHEDKRTADMESDSSLIRRLQDGDITAFDVLFEKFRRRLLAYVTGLLHDRAKAEDVVQESFVELVTAIQKINPDRGVAPWLYRVARNRAIDMLRHGKFEVLPGDEFLAETVTAAGSDCVPAPDGRLMAREKQEEVRNMLAVLPEKERDLLLLRFYGDLTFAEIAQVLRRPLGTVLWQVNRTLKKLRQSHEMQ